MLHALRWGLAVLVTWLWAAVAVAQSASDIVWVQIEAHQGLRVATERAQIYSGNLQDVNGFSIGGGWYGIALGPYRRGDAEIVLRNYRADGRIPNDSYLALSNSYQQQFWPVGANVLNRGVISAPLTADPETQTAQVATPDPEIPEPQQVVPDETPAEARRSEQLLSRSEREDLQIALEWAGFYNSSIDGAFGRGTRRSMAAWQEANSIEPTGILTTAQRAMLFQQYNAVLDGMDLRRVREDTAGIEIVLPTGVVAFDKYEFPFAQFSPKGELDAQVLLISQAGDQNTLFGLYEIMQTLEIVPLDGDRERGKTSFRITGQNASRISYTEAVLRDGQVKGFTLVWPAGDEDRRTRVLEEMRKSFTATPGVLDPTWSDNDDQAIDLVAGLQIRKPRLSRSGFFVDNIGTVVTTVDAVESCTRITLDEDTDATLALKDAQLGVAVLKPVSAIAPLSVAQFATTAPRLQSDVAVAGFSYGGVLGAPTMSFGALSDLRGLRGESELTRIEVETLEGDAGGPVFDQSGALLGMLLPRPTTGRQLPAEVSFAADGDIIQAILVAEGVNTRSQTNAQTMPPEDITAQARGMTVLVSCWD
ncbi:MAG: serine protease [Aliishimia sp.]